MMLPMPCSIICGSTALQPYHAPSRSMAKQRRQSSSVISSGSRNTLTPAQLTSTSIRPCRSTASLAIACRSCGCETSALIATTSAPCPRQCSATFSTFSAWMSLMISLACWDAKVATMASPMPWAAPVSNTTLSLRRSPLGGSGTGGNDSGSAMVQDSCSKTRQKPDISRWPVKRRCGRKQVKAKTFQLENALRHRLRKGARGNVAASLHLFCFFECECM
ncbi:hypothetical protein D3C71_1172960 [compost metagenome]